MFRVTQIFRLAGLAAVLLAAFALAACGGGGGGSDFGTLEVHNEFGSFFAVDYVETFDQLSGEVIGFSVLIFPGTSGFFSLLPGPYDVTVVYEDSTSFFFFDVDIFEDFVTRVSAFN
jgi:hypothetical protein